MTIFKILCAKLTTESFQEVTELLELVEPMIDTTKQRVVIYGGFPEETFDRVFAGWLIRQCWLDPGEINTYRAYIDYHYRRNNHGDRLHTT